MMSKFDAVPFHNNVTHKRRGKNPSFSSILLDNIYRSIDEDDLHEYPRTTPTSPTRSIVKVKDCNNEASRQRRDKMRSDSTLETVDLRQAITIESWMDRRHYYHHQQQPPQQVAQQPPQRKHFHLGDVLDQKIRFVRQKSVPGRARASDDNNSANDFSSSSSLCFTNLTPRPPSSSSRDQSSSRIFTKTKLRALKIYSELKKSKQQNAPISPGRRIAAFLNSIFRNSGGSPARSSPAEMKLNPPATATTTSNSTCSTASSFARSCLTNKTSSSGKSTPATTTTTTTKRSVRFYPVSVIVDEDSRPCGHKSLHNNDNNQDSKKLASPPNNSHGGGTVEQQRRRRREQEIDTLMMMIKTNCGGNNNQRCHASNFNEDSDDEEMEEEEEDDDDDDGGSCASSDLFELENFSSIGVSRYYEELPVYGTTSLKNLTTS